MKARVKRERPAEGGIVLRAELRAFECQGCGEFEEIHGARSREPDRLAEIRELLEADHVECWEFDDPEQARQARRYRKAKKLRENLRAGVLLGAGVVAFRRR